MYVAQPVAGQASGDFLPATNYSVKCQKGYRNSLLVLSNAKRVINIGGALEHHMSDGIFFGQPLFNTYHVPFLQATRRVLDTCIKYILVNM